MMQPGYVWPATEQDWASMTSDNYNGDIPMGAYFVIPSSVDINSLGLASNQGKMLAKACQDYGVYVCDATYNTVAFVVESLPGSNQKVAPFVDAVRNGYANSDCAKILFALRRVSTNNESNPNGGPLNATRHKPLAPPLA